MNESTLIEWQPHTGAKHRILRHHLGGWFPKLVRAGHLVVVDGFAGAGEYSNHEQGSPLIALDVARNHSADLSSAQIDFIFIEERADRLEHLQSLVTQSFGDNPMPNYISVRFVHGKFAEEVEAAIARTDADLGTPTFMMIDPFGPSGYPYSLISRLAKRRRFDLLISFMYGSMVRYLDQPNYEKAMGELYGDEGWRDAIPVAGEERRRILHDGYRERLRSAGFARVGSFELLDAGNATEYFLMFAAHHLEALKVIKAAMWSVDPERGQGFSDFRQGALDLQPALLPAEPEGYKLREEMVARFAGETVSIDEIEDWAVEFTDFRETHVRRYALGPLEQAARLRRVSNPTRPRRLGEYPPGTLIEFPPRET